MVTNLHVDGALVLAAPGPARGVGRTRHHFRGAQHRRRVDQRLLFLRMLPAGIVRGALCNRAGP